jgi:hypothetical protein
MVSPKEFLLNLSGECKIGDTLSWMAILPKNIYSKATILECDGKGYPLKKISPMSSDCFNGRPQTRDIMRSNLKRMVIKLDNGPKVVFELTTDKPAIETKRDFHWYMMGGKDKRTNQALDFTLRNRLNYKDAKAGFKKFNLSIKITILD